MNFDLEMSQNLYNFVLQIQIRIVPNLGTG